MLTLSAIFLILSLLISCLSLLVKLAIAGRAIKLSSPISGPPTYPFIGCLFSFYRNRRRMLDWYTGLLAESPTQTIVISRLGAEPAVVTANPANVEYILKANFGNFPKGKPFTDILGDLLGHGIFNVDGELWASQRKLASHEFSAKSLREFVVRILEEEVEHRLLPLLQSAVDDDMIIDLQDVFGRFTYDTICKFSLGTDPRCLDFSLPAPPFVEAFETAAKICAARATAPIYAIWKIKRALNIGSEKRLKEAVKIVHSSVEQIAVNKKMQQQQQTSDRHGDKIDLLSRLVSVGHGGEMVRDMVVSFIMAGRDTTSAAMTWLFYSLTRNRAAEQKLVSEVEATPFCSCYEALKGMKYLHACLLESMRLFPPVAWDSKHAAGDDVLPDGTRVKKGNRVTYFPYGMGRMETLWGENRFQFEPDRWFEGTGDNKLLKVVSPYVFPVFQAGPRVCLGKEMALVQMKYVIASILRRFEFEPVIVDPPVFVPFLTAHMAGGFKVRVKERNSHSVIQ